jgi:hypothetical protein
MSLFDKTNQNVTAFQNSAPFFPATMGETMSSVYDEIAGTEISTSYGNMEEDLFNRYVDRVEELSGTRLDNPMSFYPRGAHESRTQPLRDEFFSAVANLRETHPNLPELSEERLAQEMLAERQKLRDQRSEVAGRETGFGNMAAAFVGGAGAVFTDPIVLGSMLLGAPAATSVLRTAAIEGAIGAGSEVVVQGIVQSTRDRIGEGVDFERAATNVLLAGLGGAVFAGAIRGGMAGTKALLRRTRELPAAQRTPEVKSAEAYLTRKVEMEESNPFGPSIRGQMEHAKRLDNAILNVARPTRELLQDGTATARVLPLDTTSDVPVVRPVETGEQYVGRVRVENAELFNAVDVNVQKLSDIDARIVKIDEELAVTSKGDKAGATKLAKLRENRAKTTDKRKVARLDRQIEKLESDPEVLAAFKRSTLAKERDDLKLEAKDVTKESKDLARQVKKVVKKTPRRSEHTAQPTRDALAGLDLNKAERAWAKLMTDIGETAGRNADADLPLAAPAPARQPRQDLLDVDPDIEKAVKDEGFVDATLRSSAETHPDRLYPVEDANGNIVERSARQILEDHAEETELLDQFSKCIAEAIT